MKTKKSAIGGFARCLRREYKKHFVNHSDKKGAIEGLSLFFFEDNKHINHIVYMNGNCPGDTRLIWEGFAIETKYNEVYYYDIMGKCFLDFDWVVFRLTRVMPCPPLAGIYDRVPTGSSLMSIASMYMNPADVHLIY